LSVNGLISGAAIKSSFERQKQFPGAAAPPNANGAAIMPAPTLLEQSGDAQLIR
jgi:hypothetical protein